MSIIYTAYDIRFFVFWKSINRHKCRIISTLCHICVLRNGYYNRSPKVWWLCAKKPFKHIFWDFCTSVSIFKTQYMRGRTCKNPKKYVWTLLWHKIIIFLINIKFEDFDYVILRSPYAVRRPQSWIRRIACEFRFVFFWWEFSYFGTFLFEKTVQTYFLGSLNIIPNALMRSFSP